MIHLKESIRGVIQMTQRVAILAVLVCLASPLAAQQAKPAAKPAASAITITFASKPNPPKLGENAFEVTVKAADGTAVENADVTAVLVMPAMPSINMPEMRSSVPMKSAGGGRYSGSGQVSMAGKWDATVTVKRDGKELGSKKFAITAK
jgi:hypothetical protein